MTAATATATVRLLAAALAAALAAVLCGCATPPRAAAPRPRLADSDLGLRGTAMPAVPDAWWRSLNDPQLDRLIAESLRDNPGLQQAAARLRLAQAQAAAARAALLPDVRLDAGETRLKIPSRFPPALDAGSSVWAGDLGVVASWNLDLWGVKADTVAQAAALAQAASLDIEQARLVLTGAVVQAYIDLYRAHALADIAERAEAQRINILEITRRRLAAGLDTRVELREAEGAVPQARVTLMQAQSAQALAIHELAALSGRGADAYAGISRPQLDLTALLPLPAQLPVNLLARRPDVIAARARIAAADSQQRAVKAAFYPNVNLSALAGFASFNLSDLIGAGSFGYGAGPALSLPLFDGGRLRAQYRQAEAGVDSVVASYNDTVLAAVQQAADQLSLIEAGSRQLEQQEQSLQAAEDAYRLANERYGAGLASYLSVLNAETEVLDQRQQRVQLEASLAMARITLLLAVGGSFQPPCTACTATLTPAATAH
jgi:NodT family efflux transporter outer membrane factor (OMF) lipoprotein